MNVVRSHSLPVHDCELLLNFLRVISKIIFCKKIKGFNCLRNDKKCILFFSESDDGEIWYYTTTTQLQELLDCLDQNDMEATLFREICDYKEEIIRQMELTEKITNQAKGNKKTFIDAENTSIIKAIKERVEKKAKDEEEARKEAERQKAEDLVAKMHEETNDIPMECDMAAVDTMSSMADTSLSSEIFEISTSVTTSVTSTVTTTVTTTKTVTSENVEYMDEDMEVEYDCDGKEKKVNGKNIVTRSKTGSLTPRTFNIEELKKKTTAILTKEEAERLEKSDGLESPRMTRLKSSQIASGTYLFKLGMDNQFKTYVNQYTTNVIALNKPQRNEERDKKRYLSHKFSLTTASEFKWVGALNGAKTLLINTLRQTMLQLESSIQASFMHPNWHLLRKPWLTAVSACVNPKDFARALIVLQACIKPVVFANVWHDQLGHIKLFRVTANEREERKKQEKREKKEKEEEEERNRCFNHIKYTLGLKHQVWKQKGEEYRVHGQGGWMWLSSSRKLKIVKHTEVGLAAGPQKIMVQVKDSSGLKMLALDPNTFIYLKKKFGNEDDIEIGKNESEDEPKDNNASLKHLKVIPQIKEFEEIDITRALTTPGRLLYPKIAKKSRLDEFLTRRTHLKVLEERKISQTVAKIEDAQTNEEETNVDVEEEDGEIDNANLEKQLTNMISGKLILPSAPNVGNREVLNAIAKKIQSIRLQYSAISKLGKDYQCYSKGCNANSSTLSSLNSSCYSPLCMQRSRVRKELLLHLRKANLQSNSGLKLPNILGGTTPVKRPSILEQKLTAPKLSANSPITQDAIQKDLETAVASATKCDDDFKNVFIPIKPKPEVKIESPPVKNEIIEDKVENKSPVAATPEPIKVENDTPELYNNHLGVGSEVSVTDDEPPAKKPKLEDDVETLSPDAIKEMILGNTGVKSVNKTSHTTVVTTTTTTTTQQTVKIVDGVLQTVQSSEMHKTTDTTTVQTAINGTGRTIQTLNAKTGTSTYLAQPNRRFCLKTVKREEKTFKTEHAEDGSERKYSTVSTEGKVYLKKVCMTMAERRKKRIPVKYPLCSTFQTRRGARTIMVLPQHEVRKLGRLAGRISVTGFHPMAKANNSVWPYPCSRPLFKTCWLYRTVNLKSLAATAHQLRILWSCLRWDDMQVKPMTTDGKHQITTETEIMSLEMLKHRHLGQFMERTQYLRRKVVIPLELPKTVRGNMC